MSMLEGIFLQWAGAFDNVAASHSDLRLINGALNAFEFLAPGSLQLKHLLLTDFACIHTPVRKFFDSNGSHGSKHWLGFFLSQACRAPRCQ